MSNEVWYRAPTARLGLRLRTERALGETSTELVLFRHGKPVRDLTDVPVDALAVSADGRWLYWQVVEADGALLERTIDLETGRERTDLPHPDDPCAVELLTDFVVGSERLGSRRGVQRSGLGFRLSRPLRRGAASLDPAQRLAALNERLAAKPCPAAWEDIAYLLEDWSGAEADVAWAHAREALASWPAWLLSKPGWLDWLAPSPLWDLVRHEPTALHLERRPLGDAGVERLLASPLLTHLDELRLPHCAIGPAGALVIAKAPTLRYLRTLSLRGNPIGRHGARAIRQSAVLTHLERLDLEGCELDEATRPET